MDVLQPYTGERGLSAEDAIEGAERAKHRTRNTQNIFAQTPVNALCESTASVLCVFSLHVKRRRRTKWKTEG